MSETCPFIGKLMLYETYALHQACAKRIVLSFAGELHDRVSGKQLC